MRCFKCFRPLDFCLCSYTKPQIETGVKFILLMHPKEAKHQRTGTGRISHLCLKDSEIITGLDFSENVRLKELLCDSRYLAMLMYPAGDAWNAKKEGFKELLGITESVQQKQGVPHMQGMESPKGMEGAAGFRPKILMPIIIDATWFCSRKIIEHNPFLLELPKLSFAGEYRSIFTFKHEPRPECVSTVESCYYLIKELQSSGIADRSINAEPLMDAFKKLISDQLRAENERVQGLRPSTHGYDWKYNKIKEIPF